MIEYNTFNYIMYQEALAESKARAEEEARKADADKKEQKAAPQQPPRNPAFSPRRHDLEDILEEEGLM
jgi:hypothetical protein